MNERLGSDDQAMENEAEKLITDEQKIKVASERYEKVFGSADWNDPTVRKLAMENLEKENEVAKVITDEQNEMSEVRRQEVNEAIKRHQKAVEEANSITLEQQRLFVRDIMAKFDKWQQSMRGNHSEEEYQEFDRQRAISLEENAQNAEELHQEHKQRLQEAADQLQADLDALPSSN